MGEEPLFAPSCSPAYNRWRQTSYTITTLGTNRPSREKRYDFRSRRPSQGSYPRCCEHHRLHRHSGCRSRRRSGAASALRYAATPLNDAAEAQRLHAHLRSAADAVCQQFDNQQLYAIAMKKKCVAIALDRTVHDVNHPAVMALHQNSDAVKVAQKNVTSHARG
jgi:UrcA family protein